MTRRPEAARLLRPGGRLIFLGNSVQLMLSLPDEDGLPATDRLLRPFFGMHRFEWPDDESEEFHPGHGDLIRLLRRCGLDVEDLIEIRPEPGATPSHPIATLEWARLWPQRGSLEGPQAGLTPIRVPGVPAKLVVVVRTDLGMGRGKLAAQVAHAAVVAVLSAQGRPGFGTWLEEGQPKVVLGVSGGERLGAVAAAAGTAGLPVHVIRDAGRTQLTPGTPTCCAIGPAENARIDAVTGGLSLL